MQEVKNIYAIVETGGRQYRVAPGDIIEVEKLPAEEGSKIELDKVLLVAQDDKITVGKPLVEGAKVIATVKAQDKGDKIIVFKYKSKVRYRRKSGHRQLITRLAVDQIVMQTEGVILDGS